MNDSSTAAFPVNTMEGLLRFGSVHQSFLHQFTCFDEIGYQIGFE